MIIKSFQAETVAAALKTVREEMGGNAVVLKTRQLPGTVGNERIEVTACLDKATAAQASRALADDAGNERVAESISTPNRLTPGLVPSGAGNVETIPTVTFDERLSRIERQLNLLLSFDERVSPSDGRSKEIRTLYRQLVSSALPQEMIEHLVTETINATPEDDKLESELNRLLEAELSTLAAPELPFRPGDRIVFIGPPGSGKTSLMGKIAAAMIRQGTHRVKLLSLDNRKVGAQDEIQCYADLLGVESGTIPGNEGNETASNECIELIDTPALSPSNAGTDDLRSVVEKLNPTYRIATFSVLTHLADLEGLFKWLKPLKPSHLAMTMLDLTSRWGAIAAACQATDLPLAFVTNTPGGIGEALSPDARMIAESILCKEASND